MLCAILALALVLESHVIANPENLVNQLGSARYSLRESAELDLVRMGRAALPALRSALSSKDVEIRTRSVALLARIENSLLLQSTPIGIDFREVPLADAIETINRQTGLVLTLSGQEKGLLSQRRISLQAKEPLPFWKAIDALCSASQLHPASPERTPGQGVFEGEFRLEVGPITETGPVSDTGPFRVQLSSVHYQSEINLGSPPPVDTGRGLRADISPEAPRPVGPTNREFYLQFVVAAEPRLSITRNGGFKLTKAIDDRGQSLLASPVLGNFQHVAGYFGLNPSSSLRFRVDLNYPKSAGRRIKTLQGTIPVIVAMRKPFPLLVPLAEAKGKFFRNEDVALSVLEVRPASDRHPATLQISIKPLGGPAEPLDQGPGEPLGYRPDSTQQQVEILDEQGKTLSWFPSSTLYDGEETRLMLTVGIRGNASVPTTLRYHGILKANAEVPFEFRDIPIP